MAKFRKIKIKNGNTYVPFFIYKCNCCDSDIPECDPHEIIDGKFYCGDCAFKLNLINDKTYIKRYLCIGDFDKYKAVCKDGQIHITKGKFKWEKSTRDRSGKEYSEWRNEVFKRDKYTCQKCGVCGGKLNAHHIKEYSKYPELRYELSNGITLCETCHRQVHRKKV